MKIAILDRDTISKDGDISLEPFRELGELSVFSATAPHETVEHIGSAQAVLCNKVMITADIMEQCPQLEYIGLFATGFNNVDIAYAARKGITVCNAGSYSANAVAQQTFAYILDHFSRIRDYDRLVKNGEWERSPTFSMLTLPTAELEGKTLAVVGLGSIGSRVAELGKAFGMKIIAVTNRPKPDCPYETADIITAAKQADVLTLHCPLTDRTRGMVNMKLLSVMKSSAILINTSRGGTVCEEDLAHALSSGMIAGAYLDVLEKEPMSPETPLKNAKNCVITPHTSWAALETRERLVRIVHNCLMSWQNGTPINKVN